MSDAPDTYTTLLGLAQLREIVLRMKDNVIPQGPARAQANEMLGGIDAAIDAHLHEYKGSFFTPGELLGTLFSNPKKLGLADFIANSWSCTIETIKILVATHNPITTAAKTYLLARRDTLPPKPTLDVDISPYERLKQIYAQIEQIGGAEPLLEFLEAIHPEEGSNIFPPQVLFDPVRSNAGVALNITVQELSINSEIEALLKAAKESPPTNPMDLANLRIMEERYIRATALSADLVARRTRLSDICRDAFVDAKNTNNFACLIKPLDDLIAVLKEVGDRLADALGLMGKHAGYNATLGARNPGLTREDAETLFAQLEAKLPPLVKQIGEQQAKEESILPIPEIPVDVQKKVIDRILHDILGDNYNRFVFGEAQRGGCLSVGSWNLSFIVLNTDAKDFLGSLFSAIHEAGHGLYSVNLPKEYNGQPVGQWESNRTHETQSILMERMLGGSPQFMEYIKDILRQEAPELAGNPALSAENLFKTSTRLKMGEQVRIKADFVQSPLHVIVQSRVEWALFDDSITAAQVPAFRAELMQRLLSLNTLSNVSDGPARDNHVTNGNSFVPYAFGGTGAAQIWLKFLDENPEFLEGDMGPEKFKILGDWLKEKVHTLGSSLSYNEIIKHATGKGLSPDAFLEVIEERFLGPDNSPALAAECDTGRADLAPGC